MKRTTLPINWPRIQWDTSPLNKKAAVAGFFIVIMVIMAQTSIMRVGKLNNVRKCDYTSYGSTTTAKLIACIADLPSTGGIADATGFEGTQTITSNIFNGVTKPVHLRFGAGTFTISAVQTVTNRYSSITGLGPFFTKINCTTTGDCIRITSNPWSVDQSGVISGMSILGQGSSNANAIGLHISGIVGLSLRDLVVGNFKGTNSVGIWLDNGASFSDPTGNFIERLQLNAVHSDYNTVGIKMTVQPAAISNSFFYTKMLDMRWNVDSGQIGWLMDGDGTVSGSPYMYGSIVNGHFNCINGGTMWKIQDASVLGNNAYALTGETTSGAACVGMNLDSASFGAGGTGIISLGAGGTTASISANRFFHSGLTFDPGTGYNIINETQSTLAARAAYLSGGFGTYIMPYLGAGTRTGTGHDMYYDGTNWVSIGNGAVNSSGGWLFDKLQGCFYFIESTGTTTKTVSDATLTGKQRLCINDAGLRLGSVAAGATPLSFHLSASESHDWGTINANTCKSYTHTLNGALTTDSYYVTSTAAPADGITYSIFGASSSAPTVRACNVTTGNVVVGSLTMRADAWRH